MEASQFPSRIFSKGNEPTAEKSIHYYAGNKELFGALAEALEEDEWEELMNSRLGVFLKLHALKLKWASRLVHYFLSFQIECKKPFELWSVIGATPVRFSLLEFEHVTGLNCEYVSNLDTPEVEVTDEMKDFWEVLGVDIESGPSVVELTAACALTSGWSRLERMRLGYLAIFAGYIEALKKTTPTNVYLARLVMDLEAFENYPWGRVAFKNLVTSVKEKDLTKSSYTIEGFVHVLQTWVYYALPNFAKDYGDPLPDNPTPLLLAWQGSRGRKNVKPNMLKQVVIHSLVRKDTFEQMFPKWDDDVEDVAIQNIVQTVFKRGWRWNQNHWPVQGVKVSTNMTKKRQNQSSNLESGSRKRTQVSDSSALDADPTSVLHTLQAHFDKSFSDLSKKVVEGLSSCEKEINLLTQKVAVIEQCVKDGMQGKNVEPKNGDGIEIVDDQPDNSPVHVENKDVSESNNIVIPDAGSNFVTLKKCKQEDQSESVNGEEEASVMVLDKVEQPEDYISAQKIKQNDQRKAALMFVRAKSERMKKLASSQVSPFIGYAATKASIQKGKGYDPFAPVNNQKVKVLDDWLKLDPNYPKRLPYTSLEWFWILREPQEWLKESHMDAGINLLRLRFLKHPEWFRNDRICFVDTLLCTMWVSKFDDFEATPANADGSGKRLPAGAYDYYTGQQPAYCKTDKIWGLDVDDIYCPLNVKRDHWVALWISIPNRHITIWDSIVTHTTDEELADLVKPIATMIPYLLREACEAEDRHKWPYDPFTHQRIKGAKVPQNRISGDCGVYCLKYIECHSLGLQFTSTLCDANMQVIRDKFAAEIFDETDTNGTELRKYNDLDLYDA